MSLGCACAQSKAVDFYTVMTSIPKDKNVYILDIKNKDGKVEIKKNRFVNRAKFKRKVKHRYNLIGNIIDSLQLINYKLDTVYVLTTYYIPVYSESLTIKTRKDTFDIVKPQYGNYGIRLIADSYLDMPKEVRVSDYLLYKAIFSWDVDLLVRLIKAAGEPSGCEYFMSAERIIIIDNRVIEKDIITFDPALYWQLE